MGKSGERDMAFEDIQAEVRLPMMAMQNQLPLPAELGKLERDLEMEFAADKDKA
jgi:hypothetical protein